MSESECIGDVSGSVFFKALYGMRREYASIAGLEASKIGEVTMLVDNLCEERYIKTPLSEVTLKLIFKYWELKTMIFFCLLTFLAVKT